MKITNISQYGIIRSGKATALAKKYIQSLHIVAKSEHQRVADLSGGNQQKVVFAKCIASDCSVLIMDEPTRGVDVGAKEEIYALTRSLSKEQGMSGLLFSSELPEILCLCDRIFLLYEGSLVAEIANGSDVNEERIMRLVTGG